MDKDFNFLAEAYQRVLEEAVHCKAAKDGCDCDKCEDCKDNQKVEEAKNVKPDYIDLDKDGNTKESMKKAASDKKKKSKSEEEKDLREAYETILEFKHINKKFARRYNKVTAAMLKSQPGSEEYGKLKAEREDLVTILKDHGQTPKDLEAFLAKKEKEIPLPDIENQNDNQYGDNTYSDTSDYTDNTIKVDFTQKQETGSVDSTPSPVPQVAIAQ
jgi:hypothetical protein